MNIKTIFKRKSKEQKKSNMFSKFQSIGKALMLPIAVLPIAGLLLGIGSAFTNDQLVFENQSFATLGEYTFLGAMFSAFKSIGGAVFNNLPILFAISIVIGMTKGNKAIGGLAAVVGFLALNIGISVIMSISEENSYTTSTMYLLVHGHSLSDAQSITSRFTYVLGIYTYNMGVVGGIISGFLTLWIVNRFSKLETKSEFGKQLMILEMLGVAVTLFVLMFAGVLMYYIWKLLFLILKGLSLATQKTGMFGSFVFGFTERALVPFGVHHAFYLPFWQTQLGGTMSIAGQTVSGGQNIWFAQLAGSVDGKWEITNGARFWEFRFLLDLFGIPAMVAAMLSSMPKELRRKMAPLYISGMFTSLITGITEPIEFTFLFAAPVLFWGIHSVLAGLSALLMHAAGMSVGQVFSGGIIEFILFGIIPGETHTGWMQILWLGPIMFVVWFTAFKLYLDAKKPQIIGFEKDDAHVNNFLSATKKVFNRIGGGKHARN